MSTVKKWTCCEAAKACFVALRCGRSSNSFRAAGNRMRAILRERGYKTKIIRNAWWRLFIPELRPLEQNRWLWVQND